MEIEQDKILDTFGPTRLIPAEGKRLAFDLPNGTLKYENGVMRLVLEPGATVTIWERAAP